VWGALNIVPLSEDDSEAQGADESYNDEQRMRRRMRSSRSLVAGVRGGVAALSGTRGRWGPYQASSGEGKAAVFMLVPSVRVAESAADDDADLADCPA
jgi:hypothetical protein